MPTEPFDFTDDKIRDTYHRVLQWSGSDNVIRDGLGDAIPTAIFTGSVFVSGSFVVYGSSSLSGSVTQHTLLADMPDSGGINTDHDTRYVTKVQSDTPTTPTPFTGMLWWDTDETVKGKYYSITNISASYNVTSSDEFLICQHGTYTVTLPTATGVGFSLVIKNVGSGSITVDASANGGTIDGDTNFYLAQNDSINVIDGATNTWYIY